MRGWRVPDKGKGGPEVFRIRIGDDLWTGLGGRADTGNAGVAESCCKTALKVVN